MSGPAFIWYGVTVEAGGTTEEGDGSASFAFAASGVGASTAEAVGSASFSFAPTATGASTFSGVGDASVLFDATATATSTHAGAGAASFTFSVLGVPELSGSAGEASFVFTVTGVGFTTWSHFLGMTATTETELCDLIVALIQGDSLRDGITPDTGAAVKFEAFREDGEFREWAEENSTACLRKFTVTCGPTDGAAVSDMSYEWRGLPVEIVVAYPNESGGRFGDDNNRSRDHVMNEDQHAIESAVGLRGYTNLTSGGLPLATFDVSSSSPPVREAGEGVTFLVFPYFYRFFREV